ncbi:MAG TPA: hypothetical protein VE130_03345, partial [Nitrososphaeraceae archaeon]|nr:hypothetical protein [Nitrososphaeraceae archaeon]
QTLRTINSILKPMERKAPFIADTMTVEELSSIEVSGSIEKIIQTQIQTQKPDTPSSSIGATEKHVLYQQQQQQRLPVLDNDQFYTTKFVRDVNNASRKIFALLTKKGKSGEDVDVIRESLGIDNTTLIEALNKLEKHKRIQWLDDATIILSKNLENVPGEIHDIYIEKIRPGSTLVMIDGKWHARLSHYDYEGSRHLLKKGTEFRAVSELYHDGNTFCVRIKQIV